MKYALPSPYREVPHTADVGIEVDGSSPEEALARAVLAMAQLMTGGGECPVETERAVSASGDDAPSLLIDVLRKCLQPFFLERLIPAAVETQSLASASWKGIVGFGHYDPELHQGADIKAVTYAAAAFEARGDRWLARAVFDI
jgi:protein archease